LFSVVLEVLAGLAAPRERVDDDLAGAADFAAAALRTGALDLVVVFVGI
jgi:hypothetical protein